MTKLIAKVMSNEPLLDGDQRKGYTLHVIPDHCEVTFKRLSKDHVGEMHFISNDPDLPSAFIPLDYCGNVYILQDGRTMSTFNPTPNQYASTMSEVNAGPMTLGETDAYQAAVELDPNTKMPLTLRTSRPIVTVLKSDEYKRLDDLLRIAVNDIRMHGLISENILLNWNELIIKGILEKPIGTPITLLAHGCDSEQVEEYLKAAYNAVVNYKPVYGIINTDIIHANNEYVIKITDSPASVHEHVVINLQKATSEIIDDGITGLVLNTWQRIVKMITLGGTMVMLASPVVIDTRERSILERALLKHANMTIIYHSLGPAIYEIKIINNN